jgi:S-adenosylmethionine decarboxylase
MKVKDIDLPNYLFEIKEEELSAEEREAIIQKLDREMAEIFYGINVPNI